VYTATLHLDRDEDSPGRGSAAHTIELAHLAGLEVMTWTATPAQAVRAAAAGIDAVCVDEIPAVQAALAGAGVQSG
jgi:glycerophosphoryl diester phosphodiesterase